MRISALRRPCFYVRPQYTRRETKSQARRHNPPRRRVCYTIAKLERREAGYESRSGTARRAAGEYIAAHNATVRAAAAAFGCSKSTVHKDVAVRLRSISPALYGQVRAVLARNKAERHLRGGAATRRRYSRR